MRQARIAIFLSLCALICLSTLKSLAQTVAHSASQTDPQPKRVITQQPTPPGTFTLPDLDADSFFGDPLATPDADLSYQADSLVTRSADDSQFTLIGHVEVHYRGYVLNSDRADIDLNTGDTKFTGNVLLHAPDGQTVEGGQDGVLRLNLRKGTYSIIGARSTVPPEDLSIGIIEPIYIYGGTITGRNGLIDARGSSFTTCDFAEPHYLFKAKQIYIIPGRRLVAKNVTLYHKNRRILTIPYFFVPLNQRFARQTIFPLIGQTPDEGYFIKFAIGYALSDSLPGIIHLDAMQYKGLGTGFEQSYGNPAKPKTGTGVVSLYRLYDNQTGLTNLTGNLRHQEQLGTIGVSVNSQFQQNSYLAGASQSSAQNTQVNLTRSVGNLTSSLMTSLDTSNYGAGATQSLASSFSQTFQPTSKEQLITKFTYTQNSSPSYTGANGATSHREFDTNIDYTQKGKVYDLEILGVDYAQIGHSDTGSGYFGGVERLPEIRFATDGARANWLRQYLPKTTSLALSFGDFIEQYSKTNTQKADMSLDLGSTTKTLNPRNSVTYRGAFEQAFYGDGAAEYTLNGQAAYRLRIGSKSSAGATYTYLRPYGYTPFAFDQVGKTNMASLSLNYQETKQLQVTLATGFDFNRTKGFAGQPATPWQNAALQTIYSPSSIFRFRTTASYDLNRNTLLDLTNAVRVRAHDGLALDLASQYSPQQHEFSNIYGSLDLPFFRDPSEDAGYRLRAIGGYNGYTKKFDYQGLALTRSWHDLEASLVYQNTPQGLRPGSSIIFNLSLKAFPSYQPFGVGQFGQALDPSLGEVY